MEKNDPKVISFTKAREAKIEEKRRRYERVLFKHILGVYCVAEGEGLKAVELVDVSTDGLSFQLPVHSKNAESMVTGSEFMFRLYFSQETFIPVQLRILNQRPCVEAGKSYVRYGCAIDTNSKSYETYKLFVLFLAQYAESCQQDPGDLKFLFF